MCTKACAVTLVYVFALKQSIQLGYLQLHLDQFTAKTSTGKGNYASLTGTQNKKHKH